MMLELDEVVERALVERAALCELSVDEVASAVLSQLCLEVEW
jgi:hypothetical protein